MAPHGGGLRGPGEPAVGLEVPQPAWGPIQGSQHPSGPGAREVDSLGARAEHLLHGCVGRSWGLRGLGRVPPKLCGARPPVIPTCPSRPMSPGVTILQVGLRATEAPPRTTACLCAPEASISQCPEGGHPGKGLPPWSAHWVTPPLRWGAGPRHHPPSHTGFIWIITAIQLCWKY